MKNMQKRNFFEIAAKSVAGFSFLGWKCDASQKEVGYDASTLMVCSGLSRQYWPAPKAMRRIVRNLLLQRGEIASREELPDEFSEIPKAGLFCDDIEYFWHYNGILCIRTDGKYEVWRSKDLNKFLGVFALLRDYAHSDQDKRVPNEGLLDVCEAFKFVVEEVIGDLQKGVFTIRMRENRKRFELQLEGEKRKKQA